MNFYGYEPSKISFIQKSKGPSKLSVFLPIYVSVIAVLVSISLLGICLPIWLSDIQELEKLSSEEFTAVRVGLIYLSFRKLSI